MIKNHLTSTDSTTGVYTDSVISLDKDSKIPTVAFDFLTSDTSSYTSATLASVVDPSITDRIDQLEYEVNRLYALLAELGVDV